MLPHAIRHRPGCFALALLLIAKQALAMDGAAVPAATADAMAQVASPQAIAEYRRKLREYQEARAAFEQEASAYWSSIAEKRRGRNAKRRERQTIALDDYVLTQPPVYTGPKRPVDPSPTPSEPAEPRQRKTIPVVADLLKAAAEHFQFTPQRPTGEIEFKRAYARAAAAAGLTREQAVRGYSFETGGHGKHDMQSGVEGLAAGLARDLDRDRLQPAAHHQQRRIDRRAGPRIRPGADGKGRAIVRRAAHGDGPQDCGAEADGGSGALGAGRVGAARKARGYAAGLGHPCHGAGYRCRPAAADPQAADFGDLRPRQGLCPRAHRRRTGNDELDRRQHRARHGDDAAGDARAGPDLEFLPALRLRAQSGGDPQQHGGETARGYRPQDGQQQQADGHEAS